MEVLEAELDAARADAGRLLEDLRLSRAEGVAASEELRCLHMQLAEGQSATEEAEV